MNTVEDDDTRSERDGHDELYRRYTTYLEHGQHIENLLVKFCQLVFAVQTSAIGASGFIVSLNEINIDEGMRFLGAAIVLGLGAAIGFFGRPVLEALKEYQEAYVDRRKLIELSLARGITNYVSEKVEETSANAKSVKAKSFYNVVKEKYTQKYLAIDKIKSILFVISVLCVFGASFFIIRYLAA